MSVFTILISIFMGITTITLIQTQRWRWAIGAMTIQYLLVFLLVRETLPLNLAVVKLIAGWMSTAILGASQVSQGMVDTAYSGWIGRIFRLVAAVLIFAVILLGFQNIPAEFPIPVDMLLPGMILIGIGLLHLGMTTLPLRTIIGLLTVLSGFEVIYSAVETSVLVAGLLAVVNLALALIGAYIMLAPVWKENS